jgi:hypothetical protein
MEMPVSVTVSIETKTSNNGYYYDTEIANENDDSMNEYGEIV